MWTCLGRGKCSRCTRTYPLSHWLWRNSHGCREIIKNKIIFCAVVPHWPVLCINKCVYSRKLSKTAQKLTWSSPWFGCCCWHTPYISWTGTSPSGHKGECGNRLRSPKSVREAGEALYHLNSLANTPHYVYMTDGWDITLFSPGKGSMPVILRPTLFLPLVDLTWIWVWYFRRWRTHRKKNTIQFSLELMQSC